VIKANAHKYSVSAMCRVLQVNRSTYYYEAKQKADESDLTDDIKDIFRASRNNYGTRKIKHELKTLGKQISRRRIGRIMKQEGLVSNYTKAQYKPKKDTCNESKVKNVVNRKFQNQPYRNVVVSDLTYVRVGKTWNYICVLVDLYNREIIGCSAGAHKTAELVKQAFATMEGSLKDIQIFHTDRGNEFKNKLIDETLEAFEIKRSLSHKGCPYDNAVAEATFKIIKTEFVWNETFQSLKELKMKISDYVNWYNHCRIHSSLGYLTPIQYRENNLKNFV
jgi:putative transposase